MIRETITYSFSDEEQQKRFHQQLNMPAVLTDDVLMNLNRHESAIAALRVAASQRGDEMVIDRNDWSNVFEKLWG